ncbi:MAG: large-conductance mechanosensitive channel protein MscL [Flavobacteriales bacterium]|nr:large-conductance mechanosensitive channel protein MscL [Flavobacteriales bacterium]MCX7769305.1 large-conductance mechanosensitive channel protein MscL [Flavobacteriales bacterium]MDW8410495.1 large-conductance mechanosensitive channel protein MscL [Flavobacteriales bacterium]
MHFIKEFREFISRGNVIDLAVGVVIGSAFTSIVDTLVKGILMPVVGLFTGGINFAEKKLVLRPAVTTEDGKQIPENALLYGEVIQAVISFLIVAFVIFILVKGINNLRRLSEKKKSEEVAQSPPPPPSPEVLLLQEIRDLLRSKE